MKKMVESYMIRSPYVGDPKMELHAALEILVECRIRHLPVVKDGKLVGLVSERDLREAMALPQALQLTLGDIMKRDIYVSDRNAKLREVVRTMETRKVGSTIIINSASEVVGIFTTTDALGILADILEEDSGSLSFQDYFDEFCDQSMDA